jgi:sigma-B regulation protein RsbU (phosphoserine phosphatase)
MAQNKPPKLSSVDEVPEAQWLPERDRFLLSVLMENTSDRIYFKDRQSRFILVNKTMLVRRKLSDLAQIIGKTDFDFFAEEHARQAFADEQQIMQTGQPIVGLEEKETWPDGSITWASTTKGCLRDGQGRVIGTFGISRDITEHKRAEQALAERTRQLQQKNLQMEEELKMARELQLAMLPQRFPGLASGSPPKENAFEFFSFYFPTGAVSGDFFDVVELSDTKVGVFICDVMGHDVRAALVTAMMRALVQDLSLASGDPGHLLAQVNRGLVGVFKQTGTTIYATGFYLIADVAKGEVCYASAAHPDALHLRRQDGSVEALGPDSGVKRGPALGLFEDASFPSCQRRLDPGDLVVLYTDGLIEVEGPGQQQFNQEHLMNTFRRWSHLPAKDLFAALIADIRSFSGQPEFQDDVCLVGMEIRPVQANGLKVAV